MKTTLSPREMALVSYFYTIATDERVRAAGLSPQRFGAAVLDCVRDDLAAVTAYVLGTGVKEKVSAATRRVARTVLGGTVSEKAAEALGSEVEDRVRLGFDRAASWLKNRIKGRGEK